MGQVAPAPAPLPPRVYRDRVSGPAQRSSWPEGEPNVAPSPGQPAPPELGLLAWFLGHREAVALACIVAVLVGQVIRRTRTFGTGYR